MAEVRSLFVDHELIELRKDGAWYSNGEEISHAGTSRAFFAGLRREGDAWVIRIGKDSKGVQVEDTAFFVIGLQGTGAEGFSVTLSGGSSELLDPATLSYRAGRLACRLASGEEARFLRAPYHELMRSLQQDDEGYFIVVSGKTYRIAGPGAE